MRSIRADFVRLTAFYFDQNSQSTWKVPRKMAYARIIACIVVEEKDSDRTQEAIQSLFDRFVIDHMPVFDSEVSCTILCEAPGADEIRREAKRP